MRLSRQIAGIWYALGRGWRAVPSQGSFERQAPQLFLRPLEERRVLTVAVNAGVELAGAAGDSQGADLAEASPAVSQDAHPVAASEGTSQNSSTTNATDPAATALVDEFNGLGPVLVVAADQTTDEGAPLSITDIGTFTDGPSEFSGEPLYTYTIDWGDGTPADSGPATIDSIGEPGTPVAGSFDGAHTYADNGIYTVTVTIASEFGSTSDTLTVTVNNVTPTLVVAPDQTIDEGAQLSITNIGQFTDPGFDNPSNVEGEITERFTYAIDWGDGTDVDSGSATIDVPGAPGVLTAGSFDGAHTYADNGIYTVTVTLSDDDGGSVSETFTVTVNNVVPTLIVAPDQFVDEGAELSITNIGQFTDPGFDNPLNVGGETTERFTFAVDWGDGTDVDSGSATIDVPGAPGVLTAGSFDGAHTYADNGIYTVTVTLSDDDGGSVSETFTVTVNNVAPTLVVAPDRVVDEGTELSITNIGQFTDPGFDNPLHPGGATSEGFTFTIDWGDGTPLDSGPATIDVPGAPGVLTTGSFDGAHTYADNGVYTVTVTVSDDDGGTVSETFTVTVNNVTPTLVVVPDQVANQGAELAITNIGQFTDPGFDNLSNIGGGTTERFTFAVDWGDGSEVDSGSATIDAAGSPGVPTAGSFDGAHTYAASGVYTVTVTISDDDGGTVSDTFTVTVSNAVPSLVVAPDQTTQEGSLLSITNIGTFTDAFDRSESPGDYTFTIDWGDGTPLDAGLATIDVPGGPGVPRAGSFDGAHTYADNGLYTVTITITDPDGNSATDTLTVAVSNVAPTLVVAPDQIAAEGALLSLSPIGQFADPGFDNLLNVGGETTERFTFAVDWGDGSDVDSGPAAIGVPGAPAVLTSGAFNGQHVYSTGGVYTVTVTISDDDGGTTSGTFTVYIGPSLVAASDRTVNEGSLLSITDIGQFTDAVPLGLIPGGIGDPTQYTFTIDWGDGTPADGGLATIDVPGAPGVPTAGSFDGAHTYADNGLYTVTLTVTSADGRTDAATLTVRVNNVPPTLSTVPDQTVAQTLPLSIDNIGLFGDPGFDNLLNVGGETTERFTFAINWGDGTVVNSGPGTIDVAGGPGVLTAGSFDGSHVYAAAGTFTVTVTVSDDDGGSATQTFNVVVGVIIPHVLFSTPGVGAGTPYVARVVPMDASPRLIAPLRANQMDVRTYRVGSVAGAEPRLVLRIVSPAGEEDKDNDEPLANDVLDQLRKLFRRLPDGHYRIYQIQPDGIERLVVDVLVREGRSMDPADEAEGAGEAPPEPAEADLPQPPALEETGRVDASHPQDFGAAGTFGGGLLAYAAARGNKYRITRAARRTEERPLTKAQRLFRRLR